jgi:hypothetical protein
MNRPSLNCSHPAIKGHALVTILILTLTALTSAVVMLIF